MKQKPVASKRKPSLNLAAEADSVEAPMQEDKDNPNVVFRVTVALPVVEADNHPE